MNWSEICTNLKTNRKEKCRQLLFPVRLVQLKSKFPDFMRKHWLKEVLPLAFDPSFTGESGGTVRDVASPDINTDDFSAAIDYLITLPEVYENKIGIVGICG